MRPDRVGRRTHPELVRIGAIVFGLLNGESAITAGTSWRTFGPRTDPVLLQIHIYSDLFFFSFVASEILRNDFFVTIFSFFPEVLKMRLYETEL